MEIYGFFYIFTIINNAIMSNHVHMHFHMCEAKHMISFVQNKVLGIELSCQSISVQFSCSAMSDSLRHCGLQHARLPVYHQLLELAIYILIMINAAKQHLQRLKVFNIYENFYFPKALPAQCTLFQPIMQMQILFHCYLNEFLLMQPYLGTFSYY